MNNKTVTFLFIFLFGVSIEIEWNNRMIHITKRERLFSSFRKFLFLFTRLSLIPVSVSKDMHFTHIIIMPDYYRELSAWRIMLTV